MKGPYQQLTWLIVSALVLNTSAVVTAVIPYATEPLWVSTDTLVATGAAFGDLDGDGLMDLVISNGNDIYEEPETVYFNLGGTLESAPSWSSLDHDYSGHLSLGDVDNDGDLDVAVANYIGSQTGFTTTFSKMYLNHDGQLESEPSWVSEDLFNSFSVAFGDYDGDGDLDLAFARGEGYTNRPDANAVYLNQAGIVAPLPTWRSLEIDSSYDLDWADFDRDGSLDLAVCNEFNPHRVYYNTGSGLEAQASWSSTEIDSGNSLAIGDVDGDGWLDLAVSTNTQLGEVGEYKVFFNEQGMLNPLPSWRHDAGSNQYGSAVALEDVDGDGDLDLIGGQWWGRTEIYENLDGSLSNEAVWFSDPAYNSVIEAIPFGCLRSECLAETTEMVEIVEGRRLYYVSRRNLVTIHQITVDGSVINQADYCYNLHAGWISFAEPPDGDVLGIHYTYCAHLDMGVANWDDSIGNYVYRYQVATPSPTPSPTLTYSPTPTPTPSDLISLSVVMESQWYKAGDQLTLAITATNYGPLLAIDFYVVLQVGTQYFFYPSWGGLVDWLAVECPSGASSYPILNLSLPQPLDPGGPFIFWAGMLAQGSLDLVSNLDYWHFNFY